MTEATWIAWGIMIVSGLVLEVSAWTGTETWPSWRRGAGVGLFLGAFVLSLVSLIVGQG